MKPFFTLAIKVPFYTSCNISLLYSNSLLKIAPYTENDNKMNSFGESENMLNSEVL